MLPRGDGRLEVLWTKGGRRGQEDYVDSAVDDFLKRVQPGEPPWGGTGASGESWPPGNDWTRV